MNHYLNLFSLEERLKQPTNQHILIVDDEEDLRKLLSQVVSGAGYTVAQAADGEEAMTALRKHKYDLALLDIQMPNATGIDVLKFIQKNSLATRAIMLTGYADLKHAMEAREFGALDFISKPYKVQDVLGTISRVLSE